MLPLLERMYKLTIQNMSKDQNWPQRFWDQCKTNLELPRIPQKNRLKSLKLNNSLIRFFWNRRFYSIYSFYHKTESFFSLLFLWLRWIFRYFSHIIISKIWSWFIISYSLISKCWGSLILTKCIVKIWCFLWGV